MNCATTERSLSFNLIISGIRILSNNGSHELDILFGFPGNWTSSTGFIFEIVFSVFEKLDPSCNCTIRRCGLSKNFILCFSFSPRPHARFGCLGLGLLSTTHDFSDFLLRSGTILSSCQRCSTFFSVIRMLRSQMFAELAAVHYQYLRYW